jgi:endonuclease-8
MLMSGSWHLYRTGERWQMVRARMRVVIRTGDWEAVGFNIPVAEFHTTRSLERSSQVPTLGPDILSETFTVEGGVARMAAYGREDPDAEVAVVLLNQRVLAGLGNVYKSEVAFAAGVNPFRAMKTITPRELEAMVDLAQRYMKANVVDGKADGIVTYSGNRRTTHAMDREERLWVYRRQGQACRRCGTAVMMRKQGVQARSTYWCPSCQPWVGDGAAPVGRAQIVRREATGR